MSTFPLPTLAAQITAQGISAPSYSDILESLKVSFSSIYGSDSYLEADSQDGQLLAIFALAINDLNQTAIANYNSQSPTFAVGAALDRNVKINGITRQTSSPSSVDVQISGVSGTVINNGKVQDVSSNIWDLPALVIIPASGIITATAVCEIDGKISAGPGEVNQIFTPTRGWQSVTNALAAVQGHDAETDAALRRRQTISVGKPAQTPLESIMASVANLIGVGRHAVYENQGSSTDSHGIPGHSISIIVEGGDVNQIASAINDKKSPGTGTYGDTSIVVPDVIPITISFFRPTTVEVQVEITINKLAGWQTSTQDSIIQEVCDFISGLDIGDDIYPSWLYGAASLTGDIRSSTFNIPLIRFSRVGSPLATGTLSFNINEAAHCTSTNITILGL